MRALCAGFHAGRPGALAVGLAGIALLLESLTGLGLDGPRLLRPAPGAWRRSRWLHRVIGAASLAIGLVLGASGVTLALADVRGAPPPPASGAEDHRLPGRHPAARVVLTGRTMPPIIGRSP